jgi:hypothetical protein
LNEIVTELSKPIWWFSVVVAGIVINLLAAYLKTPLDKTLAGSSSWLRSKSEVRRKAWEARVDWIASSEEARNTEVLLEIRQRLDSINSLLLAIFILVLAVFKSLFGEPPGRAMTVMALGISAIAFFLSFLCFRAAVSTSNAVNEARKKAKSLEERNGARGDGQQLG